MKKLFIMLCLAVFASREVGAMEMGANRDFLIEQFDNHRRATDYLPAKDYKAWIAYRNRLKSTEAIDKKELDAIDAAWTTLRDVYIKNKNEKLGNMLDELMIQLPSVEIGVILARIQDEVHAREVANKPVDVAAIVKKVTNKSSEQEGISVRRPQKWQREALS